MGIEEIERYINKELKQFKIKQYSKGYKYLAAAIYICILNEDAIENMSQNVYPKSVDKKLTNKNTRWYYMVMQKDKILRLFYTEHLEVKDIAGIIKVSSAYVTKIIKIDSRYEKEKNFRKEKSKEKRRLEQNNFIKQKRENKKIEDNYAFVQEQHKQASQELSKTRKFSDENYRKWNSSAYKYNPSRKRYEFDEQLGRSYDVPKYVKER